MLSSVGIRWGYGGDTSSNLCPEPLSQARRTHRDRGEARASSPLTPPGVPARHRAVPLDKHFASGVSPCPSCVFVPKPESLATPRMGQLGLPPCRLHRGEAISGSLDATPRSPIHPGRVCSLSFGSGLHRTTFVLLLCLLLTPDLPSRRFTTPVVPHQRDGRLGLPE